MIGPDALNAVTTGRTVVTEVTCNAALAAEVNPWASVTVLTTV